MEEEVYDALVDLKAAIDKQTQLQEDMLAVMRALISALDSNSQELADLQQALPLKRQ